MSMIFRFDTDNPTWVSLNVSWSFVWINFSNGQLTMIFGSQRQDCLYASLPEKRSRFRPTAFFLDQSLIPVVEETKFLGLKKKGFKARTILKVIGNTERGADRKVMLRLYRYLVRSKLDYGCIVCGSAPISLTCRCWLCLGAFRTSPVESLYVDAHKHWVLDVLSYFCSMLPRSSHCLNIQHMTQCLMTNIWSCVWPSH